MDCYFAEGPHTERVCGVSGQMCRYASFLCGLHGSLW